MHLCFMLEIFGLRLVARGSVLLRLIDIPFEHATRYHVWLGHLTMALFTLHGICYVIAWAWQGNLLSKLLEWRNVGVANLPGVISLLAGLFMWVTSLDPVRRSNFELFFYTHQLYVIFIVFLALHVGDFIFSMAAGGIFLFILDRFLRFCQSRMTVDILSASCRPCGTVELVLSKPPSTPVKILSYFPCNNNYVFLIHEPWRHHCTYGILMYPCTSNQISGQYDKLAVQCSQFCVPSSEGVILATVLGEWTRRLRDSISKFPQQPQKGLPFQPFPAITASVEGPYGHEASYHLTYEHLILVAGGIGISPFLAILSDILHRIRDRKPCLPKHILIVWAVKKSKELSLISAINAESIFPSFADHLNLDIQTYITQESEPPLEEGVLYVSMNCPSFDMGSFDTGSGNTMSSLVGTGNNIWSGAYVIVSTVGFVLLLGLIDAFYIKPQNVYFWWYKGLLFIVCMMASVVMFGGVVVLFWNHWERSVSSHAQIDGESDGENSKLTQHDEPKMLTDASRSNLAKLMTTRYGCRPNFQEIFNSASERWGHVNVGVIICGPPTLQTSVAKECRSQNIRGRWNQPVFHFHSHSFDL
ncbi:hypothetical protein ACLOJK_014112 [Asimina triloba]